MPLTDGQTFGQYTIVEKIGEGGMGEVYRARDTTLDRDVAIKILPADFARDAERLARFEREAKAVAALSHPNILAIYAFGTEDGLAYAAMELLDGQPLSAHLTGAGLPPRKAAEYARQMAGGLAAAHERGIVHRDLKPDNVFVTREGRIKILDFGLARMDPQVPGSGGSTLPTSAPTAAVATSPGVVMGTAGYMSPEQVRGQPVDARTDIFALGAILYEMLTGRRAFARDTPADTMSAILNEDPPELSSPGEHLPSGLAPLVQHCLEKNPDERFQSARDLAFNLGAVSSTSGSGLGSGAATAMAGGRSHRRRSPWPLLAAGMVLGGLLAGAAVMALRPAPVERILNLQPLTFRRGFVDSAHFSPDGQTVVYGAAFGEPNYRVYATQLGTPGSRLVDMGGPAFPLAVSSRGELAVLLDRQYRGGFVASGLLARAPLQGGSPRQLRPAMDAGWGPDGEAMAVIGFQTGTRTVQLEYPAGQVIHTTDTGWMSRPRVSPDGTRVAFIDHPLLGDNLGHPAVVDRDGNKTDYPGNVTGLAWSGDGSELLALEMNGELRAYASPDAFRLLHQFTGRDLLLDVDHRGRALVATGNGRRELMVRSPDILGEQELTWFDWAFPLGLSADGSTVLFEEQNPVFKEDEGYPIYIRKVDGSAPIRVGTGLARGLSPDGQWVYAVVNPLGEPRYQLVPTGAGETRDLDFQGMNRSTEASPILPDNSALIFTGARPGQQDGLHRLDFATGEITPVGPPGSSEAGARSISPDGRWILGRDPAGVPTLYPVRGGDRARPLAHLTPQANENFLGWSEDGQAIYLFAAGPPPVQVHRVDLESGQRTPWVTIAPGDMAGVFTIAPVLVSLDGKSYAYSFRRLVNRLVMVEGLQ